MSKTIREKLKAALQSKGWFAAPSTGRYWVMVKPNYESKLFLGENGALRRGRTVSGSVSVTDTSYYEMLLETATKLEAQTKTPSLFDLLKNQG